MVNVDRFMAVGDSHCDIRHWGYIFERADRFDIKYFVQCGDFGFWEPDFDAETYLDLLEEYAAKDDRFVYWVDGNHENHRYLRLTYGPDGRKHQTDEHGFWHIRDHVYYIPRGSRWEWSGKRFLGIGGAYSIDVEWRRESMLGVLRRRGNAGAPMTWDEIFLSRWCLWCPEELITDEEQQLCIDGGPADIVIAHDVPHFVPIEVEFIKANKEFFKNEPNTAINRQRLSAIFGEVQPTLWIHGHYHIDYRQRIDMCNFQGLDCNMNLKDSWTIIDLV